MPASKLEMLSKPAVANNNMNRTSIEGPAVDRFYKTGSGYRYLALRNIHGAGRPTIGHWLHNGNFLVGIPVIWQLIYKQARWV